jgi:hypothetical protein
MKPATTVFTQTKSSNEFLHVYFLSFKISSETRIFNFGYLPSGHSIYVSNGVRICGYFSKPKEARDQKGLGNTDLECSLREISIIIFTGNLRGPHQWRERAALWHPWHTMCESIHTLSNVPFLVSSVFLLNVPTKWKPEMLKIKTVVLIPDSLPSLLHLLRCRHWRSRFFWKSKWPCNTIIPKPSFVQMSTLKTPEALRGQLSALRMVRNFLRSLLQSQLFHNAKAFNHLKTKRICFI